MAGPVITPAPVTGVDMAAAQTLTPSYVNSFRISAVTDRLLLHVRGNPKFDNIEFFNLCLSLARGIDYAVANSEVPSRAPDLPLLLKQVCQRKSDPLIQAAIMVLMISVKSACGNRWFSDKDNEELQILSNEIASSFCSIRNINTEESTVLPTISTIMTRYYPGMRMGQILAFVEAKSGYGAFVKDFHISKNAKVSLEDKIHLFVGQTDNVETSSCIISPQLVNFLLNGKGVERRTSVYRDPGPQTPTGVTHMLKYGTNLLQAVGQFNGNYIIVVAFMSVISNLGRPTIPDYIQPAVAALDSDSEIIEGPSRISLNCPISFRRIKTPVKGHLCKHLQCFDYDNFVDINSRRPSWRCPHCNQGVCFIDIRIDQKMVKVLKEVGENVADVIISADGSWKAVAESDDHTDKPNDTTPIGPLQPESTSFKNAPADIMDLTEGDNEMDASDTRANDERKPSPADFLKQANVKNPILNPIANNLNCEVNRAVESYIEDDFWSEIYLSTQPTGMPNARSDTQFIGGASESAPAITMLSYVSTDTISPALNRDTEGFQHNSLIPAYSAPGQISVSNNMQLQQYGNSNINNEYGRFPTMARNVSRTPIAVQALPAQASSGVANVDRQQQFSRSHLSPVQLHMPSPALSQHMGSQNWSHQDPSFISSQPAQQVGTLVPPAQQPSGYRFSSALPTDRLNLQQQKSSNRRIPYQINQSPSMVRSSSTPPPHLQRSQIPQGGTRSGVSPITGLGSIQQTHYNMATTQRAVQMARQSSMPINIQTSRSLPSLPLNAEAVRVGEQRGNTGATGQTTRVESSVDVSAEQNWRPTGRMRGSLSGRAYSDALSQYIIQPTPPVHAARPNLTTPQPSGLLPQLQVLMANRNNAHTSQEGGKPGNETSMAGSDLLVPPQNPSTMQ